MNESDIRLQLYHMLQEYGLWPIHTHDAALCPKCHTPVLPFESGRPDLINLNPFGMGSVIEVKAVYLERAKSFALDQIRDEQRRWLDGWVEKSIHAYLAIGIIEPAGTKTKIARIYLPRWEMYKLLEKEAIDAGKKSIGIPRLNERFSDTCLKKVTGGWELPEWHVLLNTVPGRKKTEKHDNKSEPGSELQGDSGDNHEAVDPSNIDNQDLDLSNNPA